MRRRRIVERQKLPSSGLEDWLKVADMRSLAIWHSKKPSANRGFGNGQIIRNVPCGISRHLSGVVRSQEGFGGAHCVSCATLFPGDTPIPRSLRVTFAASHEAALIEFEIAAKP